MGHVNDRSNASSFADFDVSSFLVGAGALSAAVQCAGLQVNLRALLPTGDEFERAFPTTVDVRRFSDLVSAAAIADR